MRASDKSYLDLLDAPISARTVVMGCLTFLAVYAALVAAQLLSLRDGVNATLEPLGQDFIAFYTASQLALEGRAEAVYVQPAVEAAQHALFPAMDAGYWWHYPPTAQLAVLPLALAPYVSSFLLWTSLTFGLYLYTAWRILPGRLTLLVCAAAPASFWNALHHQNGFLTAALLAAGLYRADDLQGRGGLAIGLLAIKPHLAIVTPLLLATASCWRAFIAAAAATVGLCLLSAAVLGFDVWTGFIEVVPRARTFLEGHRLPREIMPTLFSAASLAGAPVWAAYAVHWAGAATAAAAASRVWRASTDRALRTAAGLAAAMLISPYLFCYDLTALTLAGVCLAAYGREHGLPRGAPGLLVFGWLWPLLAPQLAFLLDVQLAPLGAAAVLGLTVGTTAKRPRLKPVRLA